MNETTIKSTCGKLAVITVAASAVLPMAARAETHTLQPYAYVQSHGVNRVDTGYCAKALSRYFIDFQLTQAKATDQGIFGGTAENPKCAFYTTHGSNLNYKWYYRDSGSTASTFSGAIDTQRRILTVTHSSKTEETAVLSLYDRTGAQTKTQTHSHDGTATTSLSLFALGSGSYLAGTKNIYSFEAADSSTATTPAVFLAPATNELGAAGFYDVIGGVFHGEAESSPSSNLTFSNGIGSADDYKYEDGVFSAKFHAYASDTEKGSVAFGSAEASGTAEAWVARGSSVTLKATPATDCDFVSWSGDTWAITSGDVESQTITVKSDTAVQLLATFKGKTVYTWTGAANESEPQWFTLANWIDGDGNVPAQIDDYSHFVFPQSGDVTVNYNPSDASFRIQTLTFESGAGKVTVTGTAMARVISVVCRNGQANELQNAVAFDSTTDVTATSGHVNFAGGATGVNISNHTTFYGRYNITTTGDWSPPNGSTLKTGSELNLLDGTYYDHNNRLTIESGATVTVKNTKTNGSGSKNLVNRNYGVFKATNEIYSNTELNNSGGGGGRLENTTGGGVFITPKLRTTAVLVSPYTPTKTIVGSNGIIHGASGYVRISNSGSHYFGSYADWQIYFNNHSNMGTTNKGIRKIGSSGNTTVTFDTTDYYDNTVGRTITAESGIGGSSADYASTVLVVVQGIGRFVFANTGTNDNDFAGGLTVKDSATIEVRNGARPGRGNVTLQDSTRLVVPSGRTTLGGTLAFGAGTSLVVSNLVADATAPVTANSATATAGARIVVGGTTQLKPGKYPVLTLASAEAAAAVVQNLTLDATAVRQNGSAKLVANGATVCVKIPMGMMVIVR